jgi:type III restriction enzyme
VRVVYDLSATPFFLRGSGHPEGTLFPWVVSDFSLIDAIESGVVKVPRVPVKDTSMTGDQPTFRDLWVRIRDDLPKKGRGKQAVEGEPKLPAELEGALWALYRDYEKAFAAWEQNTRAREKGLMPPVFIVVCQNTNHSKLVFDYVAGWEKPLASGEGIVVPGKLPIFSNEANGGWATRPNTILVDSEQLESGEAMSEDFKKAATAEIEEFKRELRMRFPGRGTEEITDEDLLREVMNTVGRAGKLGENVKCVVSVSMLTEGWDANTVTHILGVRAFGTQLLCEQVVGRGLRRLSYAPIEKIVRLNGEKIPIETFSTEYAEVFGVPFSFIPAAGAGGKTGNPQEITRVRAMEERADCEIRFPRIVGYRFILPTQKLTARFTEASHLALSSEQVPDRTENAPIVGESAIMTLDDLKSRRTQEVAFLLAKLVLEQYFRQDGERKPAKAEGHAFDADVQAWLFPQILEIAKSWLAECVTCKAGTFPQMLLLVEFAHDAADRIYNAIVASTEGEKRLIGIPRRYEPEGSTRFVDFDTTRPVYKTDAGKCHVSHVVADTGSWEQKMAQVLEDMPEVARYVKNQGLGFTIPYTMDGGERQYLPDFIAQIVDGHGDCLNLLIEVSGEPKKEKAAKVAAARTLWVPGVNNLGQFGRWAFLEITDPWDAENAIRAFLTQHGVAGLEAAETVQ